MRMVLDPQTMVLWGLLGGQSRNAYIHLVDAVEGYLTMRQTLGP
jgi:hypothetical protein